MTKQLKRYVEMDDQELIDEVLGSKYCDRMPALTRELATRLLLAHQTIKRNAMLDTFSESA